MVRAILVSSMLFATACSGPAAAPPASSTAASAAPVASSHVVPVVTVNLPRAGKDGVDFPPMARPDDPQLPNANPDAFVAPTMAVRVTASEGLEVNGQPAKLEDVGKLVKKQHDAAPDMRVVIMADKSVRYGLVIQVMDAIKQAGVDKIAFGVEASAP